MLKGKMFFVLGLGVMLGLLAGWTTSGYSDNFNIPEGVKIDLDNEFYQALKEESNLSTKRLSNKMSDEYLRQIAVATKYMVESNLQVLKQQERMIGLLETIAKARK